MEFDCVTTDSGGCDCYVELRKLIASVSVAYSRTHVIHGKSVNVNIILIVVAEIDIKFIFSLLVDFTTSRGSAWGAD